MVRCFNCQIKISLSESVCPYCGRVPWDGAVDIFASGDKVLLRYNGTEKDEEALAYERLAEEWNRNLILGQRRYNEYDPGMSQK